MRNKLHILFIFFLALFVFNCSEDEEETTSIPPRDRAEQQASDMDTLQNYFDTHYYNSGALSALPTYPTIDDVVISKLEEGETQPPNTTMLSNAVVSKTTTYQDVSYTYYILSIEEGLGENPHFTDQVRVNYEGTTMNGNEFDSSVNPIDLDLVFSISGWNRVLPQFKTASTFTTNDDGTVIFENYGIGVMFLPSGLGYFNNAVSGISAYSCLTFKFELFQHKVMDHDNDFIPSYMEDEDDNLDVFNDNTDNDRFNNFSDNDDDGDGYKTFREVLYTEYTDSSRSGLEAQLQALTPLNSNQFFTPIEAKDDGTFSAKLITLEDTNGNGIPNYLDSTDAQTLN
ncbi:MAG: hypothetical protein P8H23_07640 [Flavobacteriaceae bacterium]|nr:hypothetical protein [Flavobacteriaceae bacterium]